MAQKKTNWPVLAVLGVLGLLFIAGERRLGVGRLIIYLGAGELREYLGRRPFDSAKWQSPTATDGRYSSRSRMVESLLSSNRLIGMDRKQVIKLLGKPSAVTGNQYEYYLGAERGPLKMDGEVLEVIFGPSGRVMTARTSVH